jgi:hypothetical protein
VTHGDARPGDGAHEPLGSVGEEAAKLFEALQDWARESAGGGGHLHHVAGEAEGETGTGADCTWCPVCRGAQLVRQTSPEVKAHLTVAASSLLQAAAGLLAAAQPPSTSGTSGAGVQRIDLDDDPSGDESEWDAD